MIMMIYYNSPTFSCFGNNNFTGVFKEIQIDMRRSLVFLWIGILIHPGRYFV